MKKFKHGKLGLIAFIFILVSYFAKISFYPCKSSPVIAKPIYVWKLCGMDILGRRLLVGVHEMYFGFNQGWIIALLLNLVIAWLIAGLVVIVYKKFKNERKRVSKKRK